MFDNLHLQEEKEMDFLRQCNELMQQNQVILKEQLGKAEEKSKLADHEKDSRIQELQVPSHLFLVVYLFSLTTKEQVRDLVFFIEAKKKIEESPDKDDLKDGSLLIAESDQNPVQPASGKGRTRARGKRNTKTHLK